MPVPLDTLQIVKRLKEAGFAEPQAEVLTTVFRDIRETDFSLLATKSDIQLLKTDIERIEAKLGVIATRTGLQVAIGELKGEVIRWVFGIASRKRR